MTVKEGGDMAEQVEEAEEAAAEGRMFWSPRLLCICSLLPRDIGAHRVECVRALELRL